MGRKSLAHRAQRPSIRIWHVRRRSYHSQANTSKGCWTLTDASSPASATDGRARAGSYRLGVARATANGSPGTKYSHEGRSKIAVREVLSEILPLTLSAALSTFSKPSSLAGRRYSCQMQSSQSFLPMCNALAMIDRCCTTLWSASCMISGLNLTPPLSSPG